MEIKEAIKYLEQHGHISDEVKDMCIDALEMKMEEEQGLLVRLPCKYGDTVYTVCSWGIEKGVVGSIDIICNDIYINNKLGQMLGESHNIFLTREEAEAKLAEMRGEK